MMFHAKKKKVLEELGMESGEWVANDCFQLIREYYNALFFEKLI